MAVIEGGSSTALAGVGNQSASGMHAILKPDDYASLGHYAYSQVTGTIGAGLAAGSDIFQFRWTDATRLCAIYEVSLVGMYQLTAFTAGAGLFNLSIARSFTASGTGGTAATLTGDNNQLRASMGASIVGDLRIATTAALGAGTKTYDSQPIGIYNKFIPAAANSQVFDSFELWHCHPGDHPIILTQNEGIGIRATVPATGTWVVGVRIIWSELNNY